MCPSFQQHPQPREEQRLQQEGLVWIQQELGTGCGDLSAVSNLVYFGCAQVVVARLPCSGAAEGLSCHSISRLGFFLIVGNPPGSSVELQREANTAGRLHGSGWGVRGGCGKPVSQPRGLNPPFLPSLAWPQGKLLVNGISAPHVEALLLVPAAPQPAQRLVFPLLDPRAVGTDL